jgi:WD40 repeat protein/tRNA A-37 threonylcarbamoyl transferase component Bud32
MDAESVATHEREQRANEVIAAYLAAVETGQSPDPQEWLHRYPDLADELASFLAAKESFEQQAGPLIPNAPGPEAPDLPDRDSREVGDYVLLEEVARGGMGVVYRAWQKSLGRTVAVKMIRAGELASAEDTRRFRGEAELAAGLDHPGIVPIYEVGQHLGQHFFSMRLIEGGNLTSFSREAKPSASDQRRAADLLLQVARAVHHAHQRGLLHRDLKPSNVLLDAEGRAHVTDFGLAKRLDGPDLTHSHAVVGTAAYMSPEQAAGRARQLTTACDVYSLGAILYELLTGAPPFRGDSTLAILRAVQEQEPARPRSLVPTLDADLETICLRCLEKEPARRYGSAEALAEDLERWLAGEPIRARPVGRVERLAKWARRRPAIAALSTAVVTVTLLGIIGMAWQWQDARAEEDKALKAKDDAEDKAIQATRAQKETERLRKAEAEAKRQAQLERDRTARELKRAEGLHLVAQATIALPADPTVSVLLAIEGARRAPGLLANNTLRAALEACHEERVADKGQAAFPSDWQCRSSDGRRILESSQDCEVKILQAETGKVIRSLQGPGFHSASARQNSLRAVLSPDGKLVAFVPPTTWALNIGAEAPRAYGTPWQKAKEQVFYTDRVVRVWDVDSGKQVAVLKGHAGRVGFLAFSADSKSLLTTSADLTTRVWDIRTAREISVMRGYTSTPRRAVISPDGRRVLTLASGLTEKFIYPDQVPVKDGEPYAQAPPADKRVVDPPELLGTDPAWVKEKQASWISLSLEAGSNTNEGNVVGNLGDTVTGRVIPLRIQGPSFPAFGMGPFPTTAAFTPDGRRAILAYKGTRVKARVWDAETGKLIYTCRDEKPMPGAATIAISPDATRMLTIAGRNAYLDFLADRNKQQVLKGHTGDILTGCFSPDGQRAVTAGKDGSVRVWNGQNGEEQFALRARQAPVTSVRFSLDGRRLVSTAEDGTSRTWALAPEPAAVRYLPGHKGLVRSLDFSPDSKRLVTAGRDGTARIWDPITGKQNAVFQPPGVEQALRDMGLSEEDAALFSLGGQLPPAEVLSVQFSPSGKRILFLGQEESLFVERERGKPYHEVPFIPARILDGVTGRQVVGLQCADLPPAQIGFAALSPDERRVVLVEGQGAAQKRIGLGGVSETPAHVLDRGPCVRVFDATTGMEVCTLTHSRDICSAAFTARGDRLVTSSLWDVRLWEIPGGKKLKHFGVQDSGPAVNGQGQSRTYNGLSGPFSGSGPWGPGGPSILPASTSPFSGGQPGFAPSETRPPKLLPNGSLPYPAPIDHLPPIPLPAPADAGPFPNPGSSEPLPAFPLPSETAPQSPKSVPAPPSPRPSVHHGLGAALLEPPGTSTNLPAPPPVNGSPYWRPDIGPAMPGMPQATPHGATEPKAYVIGKAGKMNGPYDVVAGPALLSPDGKRVLVHQPPRILDLETGKLVCKLQGNLLLADFNTSELLCELDGNIVLTGVNTPQPQSRYPRPTTKVPPLQTVSPFSPDGRRLVGPTREPRNDAVIWDAATGTIVCRLRGHLGRVIQARFSHDGRLVVSVSEDQTARVWDAESGKELHTLTGHQGPVIFAAFSPDGKRVATAGADGARIWELDLLAVAAARRPRELTPEERQRYEVTSEK